MGGTIIHPGLDYDEVIAGATGKSIPKPTVTTLDKFFESLNKGLEFGTKLQATLARPTYNFKTDENVPVSASLAGIAPSIKQSSFLGLGILLIGGMILFALARKG